MNLPQHIELVKTQIQHHRYILARQPADRVNPQKHESFIAQWKELLADLEEASKILGNDAGDKPPGSPPQNKETHEIQDGSALIKSEYSDLPEELLKELGFAQGDQLEIQIEEVINIVGKPLSVNDILIALFRSHGQIQKRKELASKLYRMVRKGTLVSQPNKKGHYLTRSME